MKREEKRWEKENHSQCYEGKRKERPDLYICYIMLFIKHTIYVINSKGYILINIMIRKFNIKDIKY